MNVDYKCKPVEETLNQTNEDSEKIQEVVDKFVKMWEEVINFQENAIEVQG